MKNISDVIEAYLKRVLQMSGEDIVEIKRSEIADRFECVPSANQLCHQDTFYG